MKNKEFQTMRFRHIQRVFELYGVSLSYQPVKKNLILLFVSLGILCAGYVLTRYVFFDLHGMKQWPLVLFICGLVVIGISFITRAKQTPVFSALAYIAGFAAGAIFQTDGLDPGGGRTNNLWIIWTVVFVCSTLAAIFTDLIAARKRRRFVI